MRAASAASRSSAADGLDTRYAATVAGGTNLVRWLTALPPNVLDAAGYRAAITRLAREHGAYAALAR